MRQYRKYDKDRQAKDDNIIRRMRLARCISKGTDTHSEYVIIRSYSFSMTTMVTQTLPKVTFIETWPVLLYKYSLKMTGINYWKSQSGSTD